MHANSRMASSEQHGVAFTVRLTHGGLCASVGLLLTGTISRERPSRKVAKAGSMSRSGKWRQASSRRPIAQDRMGNTK